MAFAVPISPYALYENQKDGVIPVSHAQVAPAAAATADVATAVSGKVHRVISMTFIGGDFTTNGTIVLTSGSGPGTTLAVYHILAAVDSILIFPEQHCGWVQTNVGEKLTLTAGGVQINASFRYITFTP